MMANARADFDTVRACPTALVSPGRTWGWIHRHLPGGRFDLGDPELLAQLADARAGDEDMVLIPHRQKNKLNGQMSDGTANPRRPDRPALSMHPDDAAKHGISEDDAVLVATDAGSLATRARLDDRYRRGVVSLPHGFGDTNVNQLTDVRKIDPLSGMVILGAFAVTVEKLPAPTPSSAAPKASFRF